MKSAAPVKTPAKAKKRPVEPIALRVALMVDPESDSPRKALVAASASDAARLATKGNKVGDLIFARITKPRSPGFHRLAHRIGTLAVENIDEFAHLDAHAALKRLQIEAQVGCDMLSVELTSVWGQVLGFIDVNIGRPVADMLRLAMEAMGLKGKLVMVAVPRSLSYDSMDEIEFKAAVKGICKYMATRYWPSMTAEEIENIAETTQGLTDGP